MKYWFHLPSQVSLLVQPLLLNSSTSQKGNKYKNKEKVCQVMLALCFGTMDDSITLLLLLLSELKK
jgi:hypothetical protein